MYSDYTLLDLEIFSLLPVNMPICVVVSFAQNKRSPFIEQDLQWRAGQPILYQAVVDIVCFPYNPSAIRFCEELKERRVVI